ncbi:hypothetical protein FBEOM_9907 [Fusarium beomiforme]|uniref:Uncharacterized protein n=1 Tax=Fusarium beomiforme TaxID=44412 RepID=A0A9P5DT48_9HYPO|nr:hypothetical protein FBEOM_9907 [Fusarium beomiforme]
MLHQKQPEMVGLAVGAWSDPILGPHRVPTGVFENCRLHSMKETVSFSGKPRGWDPADRGKNEGDTEEARNHASRKRATPTKGRKKKIEILAGNDSDAETTVEAPVPKKVKRKTVEG